MEMDSPAAAESSPSGLPYQNSDAGSRLHSDLELTPIPSAPLPPEVSDSPLENELQAEAATPVEDLRAPSQREPYSDPILDPSDATSDPTLLQQESRRSLERGISQRDSSALLLTSVPLPDSRLESLTTSSTDASASDSLRSSDEMTSQHDGPERALGDPRTTIPLPASEGIPLQCDPSFSTRRSRSDSGIFSVPRVGLPLPPPFPASLTSLAPIVVGRSPDADIIGIAFEDKIREAVEVCEHLRDGRIRVEARHNRGKVTVLDYGRSTYRQEYYFVDESSNSSYHREGVFRDVPGDVSRRLVIIEDLYPDIINFLVANFGITPEFFEEHLCNSGYGGPQYNDPSLRSWKTKASGMKQSYVSMKWYRPAWRLPVVPFSTQDSEDLLNSDPGRLEYTFGKSNDLKKFETKSNIFRSEWNLWTDLRTTTRMKRLCGWEERASIWKVGFPDRNYDLVILLLDPLPTLKVTSSRAVHEQRRLPDSRSRSPNESSGSQNSTGSHSFVDPEIRESDPSNGSRSVNSIALGSRRRLQPQGGLRLVPQWILRFGPGAKKVKSPPVKTVEDITFQPVIEQIGSRVPFDISLEAALQSPELREKLRSQIHDTKSTLSSFDDYQSRGDSAEYKSHFGVVSPLFGIFRRDLLEFIKLLHNILDGINSEILDDMKMEDRLSIWRQIISRAQLELPEIRRSMQQFFTFLTPEAGPSNSKVPDGREENTAQDDLQECSDQIDEILLRLQTASSSLTSNMALLDSRRSIAEAQNVTRLTELAFLFIPLTFAATLLGMQIDQFENRVPLSTFVILGVSFTGFSYAVRLIIRSMWLRAVIQSSKESIKIYADRQRQPVQRGYVPTSLFLRWLSQLLWSWFKRTLWHSLSVVAAVMVFVWRLVLWLLVPFEFFIKPLIYIGLICVVPVSVLWTREMDQGIQVAITVAVVFSVSVIVLVSYWRSADPEVRGALPRMFKREFRRFQDGNSPFFSLLLWVGSGSTVLIPIAILWTKSVTQGIKDAVTIVVFLTMFTALITYGMFYAYELAIARQEVVESETESEVDSSDHSFLGN